MKRIIISVAALFAALGGGISVLASSSGAAAPVAISAPMRTVLLPPIPAPPVAPVVVHAPAVVPPAPVAPPSAPTQAPVATASAPAPAQPGPQPYNPGVTVEVPQCVVTWTTVEQLPEPMPAPTVGPDAGVPGPSTMTVQDSFDGNCDEAQGVAADHPGSTIQQVTLPQTS